MRNEHYNANTRLNVMMLHEDFRTNPLCLFDSLAVVRVKCMAKCVVSIVSGTELSRNEEQKKKYTHTSTNSILLQQSGCLCTVGCV